MYRLTRTATRTHNTLATVRRPRIQHSFHYFLAKQYILIAYMLNDLLYLKLCYHLSLMYFLALQESPSLDTFTVSQPYFRFFLCNASAHHGLIFTLFIHSSRLSHINLKRIGRYFLKSLLNSVFQFYVLRRHIKHFILTHFFHKTQFNCVLPALMLQLRFCIFVIAFSGRT